MVIILNIVCGLAALILLLGIIGEKDNEHRWQITYAFLGVIALIICANTIF